MYFFYINRSKILDILDTLRDQQLYNHNNLLSVQRCVCVWGGGDVNIGIREAKLEGISIFEYNQRLYSLGGLAGNDQGFEHSICVNRGHAASKRN